MGDDENYRECGGERRGDDGGAAMMILCGGVLDGGYEVWNIWNNVKFRGGECVLVVDEWWGCGLLTRGVRGGERIGEDVIRRRIIV